MGAAEGAAPRIRSFVAIELEEPARAAIIAYLAALRGSVDGVAWTPPENLHLTLKFLGSVAPEGLRALTAPLAALATVRPVFAMTFAGVGAFPSAARPRVLWVGAHAPELVPLAKAVDVESAVAGVAAEDRPYHPHVTLGRVRRAPAALRHPPGAHGGAAALDRREPPAIRTVLAADQARAFGACEARALVLFRSDAGPKGARHTPLERFTFHG